MILACQKIEKAFGGKSVLNNVNFLINEGEKAAVIGINGCLLYTSDNAQKSSKDSYNTK